MAKKESTISRVFRGLDIKKAFPMKHKSKYIFYLLSSSTLLHLSIKNKNISLSLSVLFSKQDIDLQFTQESP